MGGVSVPVEAVRNFLCSKAGSRHISLESVRMSSINDKEYQLENYPERFLCLALRIIGNDDICR
jgi:hypothetical protein